jgi:hypothetical protein
MSLSVLDKYFAILQATEHRLDRSITRVRLGRW